MTIPEEHDFNLTASGRIDAPLGIRESQLRWSALSFRPGEDGLHFEVSVDVRQRSLDEIEAAVSRLGLAVQAAVLAASGTAASVVVEGFSYPDSPSTRRVGMSYQPSWVVEALLDREPASNSRGARAFEAVLFGGDARLPELYRVFWLGTRAAQTIVPVVGLWAFTTILGDETRKDDLDHLDGLLGTMS